MPPRHLQLALVRHVTFLQEHHVPPPHLIRPWCRLGRYQLGLGKATNCPLYSPGHTIATHPDSGTAVAGEPIPDMEGCVRLVTEAHRKLMPRVPLVGWDVAITKDHGETTRFAWLGLTLFGRALLGRALLDFAWPCLAWPCLAWPCLAWPCLAWPCLWPDIAWFGLVVVAMC